LFTSLAGRYAKALFNEGLKTECLEPIFDNFAKLEIFFKNNQSLKKLLTSGCLSVNDLDIGWNAVGDHLSFCPVFLAFIRQVVANRRFNIMNRIRHVYTVAFAKHKDMRNVVISSVVELLPEQKERAKKLVAKLFSEKAIITYKINEKILAGIKISSEEVAIDASAFAQLKQLSKFYKNLKIESVTK
jgi:F-type H+-transporting ATPase subunit delta